MLLPIFLEMEQYYFKEQAAPAEAILEYLNDGLFSEHSGVRVIAAFMASTMVGFATYSILYPAPRLSGQMFIKDLFVSEKARGLGAGKKLMRYLANLALEKGCSRLDWTAETTNPRAGAFYLAIGASLIREKEYYRFEGDALRSFAE